MAQHVQGEHIKDRSKLWDQYVKEADSYDQDLVQELSGDLDALLIFAGLFSAINTAFIIESYQDLKPDPTDATTLLLRTIAYSINNSTVDLKDLQPNVFVAPRNAVIVNSLYFASLSCSLFAAFGAVLAKQWLIEYRRTGKQHRSSYDRAHRRHIKYLGTEKYPSELVVQALGTILQVSLFLFFTGLIEWLWPINTVVASVVTAGAGVTFLFYFTTTITSILDHSSPFSTRVSAAIRNLWPALQVPRSFSPAQEAECIAWLRDNASTFEGISAVAGAITLLSVEERREHGLEMDQIGRIVLQSIISDNAIPAGLFDGSLHSILYPLSVVLPESKDAPDFPLVIVELNSVFPFAFDRDMSLSATIIRLLEVTSRHHIPADKLDRDLLLHFINNRAPPGTRLGAGLSLLYRYFIAPRPFKALREEYELSVAEGLEHTWQHEVSEAIKKVETIGDVLAEEAPVLDEFKRLWAQVVGT